MDMYRAVPVRLLCSLNTAAQFRVNTSVSDPNQGGQKLPIKVGKKEEISCFEVLDVLF
jgi:hypothetical protein